MQGERTRPDDPSTFVYRMEADLDELARLAERFEEFAEAGEVPQLDMQRISLAMDELVTNIIQHGTEGDEPARIQVSVTLLEDSVRIEIEHRGIPFDPFREAPAPDTSLPLEERPIGGLGVFLVQSLMTTTHYERIGNRNRVTLTRSLPTGDQEESHEPDG